MPVGSHMIATEVLPVELARQLSPRGRNLSDTRRMLCYYRLSPDGRRMIFGGRASARSETEPKQIVAVLYRHMLDRFPQLKDVRVTHGWAGNVAFTFDFLPHMGHEGGLHYCVGCNGNGVATMSYLGHQTARRILTSQEPICTFDGRRFPQRPYYNGNPWFLPLAMAYYEMRDRLERFLADN
jgi:glycine/D-amino acid oxidase-like deaminating enzyme